MRRKWCTAVLRQPSKNNVNITSHYKHAIRFDGGLTMLRSRKHSSAVVSSPSASSSKLPMSVADEADAAGKDKAFFSNRAVAIVFSSLLLFTLSLHHYYKGSSSSKPIRIPFVHIDDATKPRNVEAVNVATPLTPAEDARLETNPSDHVRYHLVFSTDCSSYQHWQSYLVYYSAMKVRQPGHVTRIASGCNDKDAVLIQEWFDTHVKKMSSRFHLHLTPHFSKVTGGKDYKFFNKPFGLRHWLENASELTDGDNKEDDIVILIDPDMALLRPITGDFTNSKEVLLGPRKKKKPPFPEMKVQHGKPFAQAYGLGSGWLKFDLSKIAGTNSPAVSVVREDAGVWYPAGPPYIATLRDMLQIAIAWTEFAPRVYAEYPHLLAEMYAYCIAAAHLQLKHKLVDSLMVSNPTVGGEAWKFVDGIPLDKMCGVALQPQHLKPYPLPAVVHMCQRYALGEDWFFGKRRVPHDVFTCDRPLLEEPPSNAAVLYDFKKPPGQVEPKPLTKEMAGREAFMVCSTISLLNEAATFYKQNYCQPETMNLSKEIRLGRLSRPKNIGIGQKY